ncbi:ABC transporter substrate-binding protein [Pelagibacterium luteolum]|uniref:Amino acid ABC transporter substrate-binding protein, PAAT family n=1 Tax=Pelagibacterium luteolum TaxID=440168 RepID=A0A1G7WRX3_9HYPH|nr:ABC transporter substrate-binding protein [Pelagibacterium luteolum]SDG73960.1 amino acid ABC transporter substrate-binding protein, PAAT family [Pelagibacterium luteolum]
MSGTLLNTGRLALVATLAGSLLATAAIAQEGTTDDPRLFTPGQLTVATSDPVYPPWMMDNDPANGEGFESALVYAIAEQMGFAPEDVVWVRETFDQAIAPGAKDYDFGIQQISVTEARSEIATFSDVYYQPEKAVVALPDSSVASATSFDELREANWGVAVGTTDLTYLQDILGIDDAAVYDDQVGVFQALQGGQIDATVVALPTALFVTAVQVPDAAITAILPKDENDLGHGLIFEQGNEIVGWVNEAIGALEADGTIDALVAEYLIADPDLPVISE